MISERAMRVDSSGIRKVFELAAKIENPVDFSIGQPDFDVPDNLKDAAIEAIKKGLNRYTLTQGIGELRGKDPVAYRKHEGKEIRVRRSYRYIGDVGRSDACSYVDNRSRRRGCLFRSLLRHVQAPYQAYRWKTPDSEHVSRFQDK